MNRWIHIYITFGLMETWLFNGKPRDPYGRIGNCIICNKRIGYYESKWNRYGSDEVCCLNCKGRNILNGVWYYYTDG